MREKHLSMERISDTEQMKGWLIAPDVPFEKRKEI